MMLRVGKIVMCGVFIGLMFGCLVKTTHRLEQKAAEVKESFRVRCEQVGGIVVPRNVGTFLGGSSYQYDCMVVQK